MDSEALKAIQANPESVVRYVARQRLITYARYLKPNLQITNFHKVYYEVLDTSVQSGGSSAGQETMC